MKKLFFLMTALVTVFLLVSCQSETTSSVLFENRTLVLEVGEQVNVSLNNEDSVLLSDVVFSSQDEHIVTISANGELTGVTSGFTSVSLTYEGQVDYIIVSVFDPNDLPVDGKEVSLRVNEGFIQWQYVGEDTWTNLVALESLIGPNGLVGAPGQDGDQVEFRVEGGFIQWKYIEGTEWTNLLSLTSITGVDGDQMELQVSETHIQWKLTKSDVWTDLIALSVLAGTNGTNGLDGQDGVDGVDGQDGVDGVDGQDGVDGKEVEIHNNGTHIQWRYVGEETWTNLALVDDLKGEQGVSVVDAYFDTEFDGVGPEELDVDMKLYFTSSINTPYYWQRNQVMSNWQTELDDDNQIIEHVYEGDEYEIYYSGYGSGAYQDLGYGNDYGYEYFRVEGVLSENLTLTLQDHSGMRPSVQVTIKQEGNLVFEETYSNWTSADAGEGEMDIIDVYTLNEGSSDLLIEMRTLPYEFESDLLVFELSDGSFIHINYTEMYKDSQTYNDLLDYIDELHHAVSDELMNAQVLEVLRLQYDMYEQLLTAYYNSPLNSYFESSYLGLNNDNGEGGMWIREFASALAFQYFFELSMNNEIEWDQDSLMMNAFQVLFGEGFYFLEDFFDYLPSYELAYGLGVSSIYNWAIDEEVDYEDYDYLPLMPLIEYLSVLSTYDESSFYQYLTLNPNTDWDFNSHYDRYEYMTSLALRELDHNVYVDLDPQNLGIELITTDMPYGYYGHSNSWIYGGEEGVYDEDFNSHYYNDIEISFGRMFPTIDLGENIYDLYIHENDFYAYVNYGASFPLPKQNAFTSSEYYVVTDGEINRYFKLEGYTYSNEYNYNVDSFDNVAFGSDSDEWYQNYYSFDGYYTNPFDDSELYLEAVWVEYFLVSFYDDEEGGDLIKSEYVRIYDDATPPTDPVAERGYEFDGWDHSYTYVQESLDLYPIFDPIIYTITYENLGSANNAVGNVSTYTIETPTITLADPTNLPEGYEFNGWFITSDIEITQVTIGSYGDITLYARIDLITYEINYVLDGGTEGDNPSEFNQDDLTITLDGSYKTGYSFDGWYSDSSFENEVTSISTIGDKTLYAKFTINEYTITFDTNGGSTAPNQITQNYDSDITAPSNPTRTGYEFIGWVDQFGDSFSFTSMPAYNPQLTAQWEIEEYDVRFEYSVFENSNVEIDTQTVEYDLNATLPTPPELPGYRFISWEGSALNVTEDRTVTAVYQAINYQIAVSVVSGEGAVQVSGRPNVDRTITIEATAENGYAFTNWVVYYYDEYNQYQTVSVVSSTSSSTTFVMPAYNVVIEASFEEEVAFPATLFLFNDQLNDELTFNGSVSSLIDAVTEDVFTIGGYQYLDWYESWSELFNDGGSAEIYVNGILYAVIMSTFDLDFYSNSLSYLVTSAGSTVDFVFRLLL